MGSLRGVMRPRCADPGCICAVPDTKEPAEARHGLWLLIPFGCLTWRGKAVREGHKGRGLFCPWRPCQGLREVPGDREGLGAKGDVSPAPWLSELGATGQLLEHSHDDHISDV